MFVYSLVLLLETRQGVAMGYQWVRVGFLFFSALVFSSRSFAPDLSYSSALGVGAVAISSMGRLFSRDEASVYPQGKRFCCTDDSSARVPLPPEKNNLHVISLPPEAMKAADVNLPALPDGRKPENVKGAVVSRTPGLKGGITLKFFPGSRAASFDWFNEEGELSREYVLLREKDEGALDEDDSERLSVSGGAFNNDLWEVYSWEVHHGDSNNGHKTEEQEWLKKSAAAMQATFEKILDMIYGDRIQIYFPEQSIYSPGPGDHGLAVAVVYFRPGYFLPYGPSGTHRRNWLTVLGVDGSDGATPIAGRKRKRAIGATPDANCREKIAKQQSIREEFAVLGAVERAFVDKAEGHFPKEELDYLFDFEQMPESFPSPVLHMVFRMFLDKMGELEPGQTAEDLVSLDPLLFDTFSYLSHLALESDIKLSGMNYRYVKHWVTYFEMIFSKKLKWKERFSAMNRSKVKTFLEEESDVKLSVKKPDDVASDIGFFALRSFKKDLRNSTAYWTSLRKIYELQAVRRYKPHPVYPKKMLLERFNSGNENSLKVTFNIVDGLKWETLEELESLIDPSKKHADPYFIPFLKFVFRRYLDEDGFFDEAQRRAYYRWLDSVTGYSNHYEFDWEFWLGADESAVRPKDVSKPVGSPDSGFDEK